MEVVSAVCEICRAARRAEPRRGGPATRDARPSPKPGRGGVAQHEDCAALCRVPPPTSPAK